MFKFLRLSIDLGQDEFWLAFTLSCTLHHDFSPLIFICPNPIANHFYLISALFTEAPQVNSSNLLTIWVISSWQWRNAWSWPDPKDDISVASSQCV